MPINSEADKIFQVYESFLKSLRPRIPKEISLLLLLVVTVMGAATLYHRVFKQPLFPNELDIIRIVLMLGYLGLTILPVIVSLFRPSPNRLTQYKAQARQDEEVIRALRAASSRELHRFQKFLAEALRLEEKYAELSAFVLALIGSLLLAFAHGLGSVKLPYSWLLIAVSLLAVSVQFFKWQVARKQRFVVYLEAAEEEDRLDRRGTGGLSQLATYAYKLGCPSIHRRFRDGRAPRVRARFPSGGSHRAAPRFDPASIRFSSILRGLALIFLRPVV